MLEKIVAICMVLAITLLITLLHTTDPTTIGPVGILVVFILMYLLVLSALTFLLFFGSKLVARIMTSFAVKKPLHPLSIRKAYYFSSVLSLAPVMFIAMQSVGEVGLYDVILVALFVAIACMYISKRTI